MDKNTVDFESFWLSGPWLKLGKKRALRHFNASVKTREDWERIQRARDVYAAHLAKNSWKHPQHGSTWFNSWEEWSVVAVVEAALSPTGFHWCPFCEHEWQCTVEDCGLPYESACPEFLAQHRARIGAKA